MTPAEQCPGQPSKLHAGVMRMCPTSCARWAWEADGMQPAMDRVDGSWSCPNWLPRWPSQHDARAHLPQRAAEPVGRNEGAI